MKEKKITQIVFCSLIIVVISFIGIFTFMNNKEKSEVEGRKLTVFPKINLESITKDKFYTKLTDAFSDQLIARDRLVKIYYNINIHSYISGIAKGKENQLFMDPLIILNEEQRTKDLETVTKDNMNKVANEVTKAGSKFIFISIPRKDVLMQKYLPYSYINTTQNYLQDLETIKNNVTSDVQVLDAYSLIKDKEDKPYYSTDHHMNIRGAYILFKELVKIVNNDGCNIHLVNLEDEFKIESKVLNGSFNRKIGQSVKNEPEELTLIYKNNSLKYVRQDNGKVTTTPIFGSENTYASAYMGADYAETIIDTNNDEAPNILFVGTSFTNVLEALSVCKFNKVVGIDYRHNKTGKTIADYVKEHDIDYTIFICSLEKDGLSPELIKEYLG